jgi:epoxyqueuosine reductase QueG
MRTQIKPGDLRQLAEEFVAAYPASTKVRDWWLKPLLVTAVADERFDVLPRIVAKDHLLPKDLLPSARSVIVYFLPFVRELAEENQPGDIPCRNWGLAYNDTNELIKKINDYLADYLGNLGYGSAVTPPTANFDPVRLVSQWSHKHLAHLAGLGRFGVNCQLITPVGCTGRLGSLVTEAELSDSPLVEAEEHCLHKRDRKCLECVGRCPVNALGEESFDRDTCYDRLKEAKQHENFADLPEYTEVCGKCQVMLPCSFGVPE